MTADTDENPPQSARRDEEPVSPASLSSHGVGLYERSVRAAHRGYKVTLSPFFGQSCRFLPTCSDYGRDALIRHGPIRGGWLTLRRVCKCHPFGASGYDPVPPAPSGAEKTK